MARIPRRERPCELGSNLKVAYRLAGITSVVFLAVSSPKKLSVMSLDNFELVINLQTAKDPGQTIPPRLLARADDIIM
jgi:hypothetical protein